MNSESRSWSAGTRRATRSYGSANLFSLAPQSCGAPYCFPLCVSKNHSLMPFIVVAAGGLEFNSVWWTASASSISSELTSNSAPVVILDIERALTILLYFRPDFQREFEFRSLSRVRRVPIRISLRCQTLERAPLSMTAPHFFRR